MQSFKSPARSQTSSPNKSPLRSLPETHIIQDRYSSYSRAEGYIKHLNKIYNSHIITSGVYDEAYYSSYKFRQQEPKENSVFKVSQFPKAKVNQELLEQQEILNAFNQISVETRPKAKPRPKSTVPTVHRPSVNEKTQFTYKQKPIIEEKCEKCKKANCQCPKVIHDHFLKKEMKKHMKVAQKVADCSIFGEIITRKSQFVVSLNRKPKKAPLRSNTFDVASEKPNDFFKKSNKRPISKESKRFFDELAEKSLSISPVSLSLKSPDKDKPQKVPVFKDYLKLKLLERSH